jgi:hypothetical protein
MKSRGFVILLALLALLPLWAQNTLDREIVILGTDQTVIELPEITLLDWPEIPAMDLGLPDIPFPPPVVPPWGDWVLPGFWDLGQFRENLFLPSAESADKP